MNNTILAQFSVILDQCRIQLSETAIAENADIKYVVSVLYAQSLRVGCEIYTLLDSGYPEGAMALSRYTFEALVLMEYLKNHKDDQCLIDRFCKDRQINDCQIKYRHLSWLKSRQTLSTDNENILDEYKKFLDTCMDKYREYVTNSNEQRYFSQYWWIAKGMSFRKLCKETEFEGRYYYDIACCRVHASISGLNSLDNSEEGILIGNCQGGKEMPLSHTLLNLRCQLCIWSMLYQQDVSNLISTMDCTLKQISD